MKKAIIVLAILVILAGIALYFKNFKSVDDQAQNGDKPITKYDEMTIPRAIDNFYKKYESCVNNTPAAASGKISEYCQNNTGLTTAAFAGNLEKGGTVKAGADPVFCAQGVPETIKTSSNFQMKNNKATGFIVEKFGTAEVKPEASLVYEGGVWKVDNITCPGPVVGGDRDEHDCIGSAGYSWCEEKQKCLRIWEEPCGADSISVISQIVKEKLAEKYNKPLSDVNVTVTKTDATHAAGSVLFGKGGPGEGGIFLAVKIDNAWQVVFDGNGNVDCAKMREQYKFSDKILKPEFCD